MSSRELLVALLCAALTACSSPTTTEPDAVSSTDDGRGSPAGDRSNDEEKQSEPGDKGSKGGDNGGTGGSGTGDAKGSGAGSDETEAGDPGSDKDSTASAALTDRVGDTESSEDPPAYTDIVAAGIQGGAETVRLTITVNDQVPKRMPDADTFFSVDTSIEGKGKPYSVYADGTANGWTAYVTHGGDTRKLPGAFHIEGDTTVIEVPWSVIGGQRRFRWSAETSWSRTTLTSTYYSFDEASRPNGARYPGR
jgi:hypothetical protein